MARAHLRRPLDFMIWNHVFMLAQTARALGLDTRLFALGLVTSVLSVYRHLHRETRCNTCEPALAKLTLCYVAAKGLGQVPFWRWLLPKCLALCVWLREDRDYERLHPWLHVLVAVDAGWYLDALAR